jgi:hypothetical protein
VDEERENTEKGLNAWRGRGLKPFPIGINKAKLHKPSTLCMQGRTPLCSQASHQGSTPALHRGSRALWTPIKPGHPYFLPPVSPFPRGLLPVCAFQNQNQDQVGALSECLYHNSFPSEIMEARAAQPFLVKDIHQWWGGGRWNELGEAETGPAAHAHL